MKRFTITSLLFSVMFNLSFAQVFSDTDKSECNKKFELAIEKNLSEKPIGEIIAEIGKSFISTPYEAHTLEISDKEQLVIKFSGLDCTTFLETTLALARCIKNKKLSFEDFADELTLIRYRDGIINEYPSRLHYFSDWIFNNTQKGIVSDFTRELKVSKPIKFNVYFMSKNPDKYKHLKNNSEHISVIKSQEDQINNRTYYYVPENHIREIEKDIMNGDLIALTTSDKGLDIGHVGIAVKMSNGRIHFLHAPQVGSHVQITEEPLSDYVKRIKKHTGIIVLRAN